MKKIEEPKKTICMIYEEDRRGGDVCKGQENQSYPDREPEIITFDFKGASIEPPKYGFPENIQVDFNPEDYVNKPIYFVIARYTDGDTFGHTEGYWHVVGVYTDRAEAKKIKHSIEDGTYTPKGKYSYIPWKGYFSSLESVDVHETTLDQRY